MAMAEREQFWSWFREHSAELSAFETDRERVFEGLRAALQRVAPGLCFEIGSIEGGARDLVVSADGNRKLFPAVEALVAAAPGLPGWRIVPFRPRAKEGCSIQLGNVMLATDDLWFASRQKAPGQPIDLWLHIPGFVNPEDKSRKQAAYILLDSVIGEYDTEMKLGGIGFRVLPADPATAGLRPLRELTAVVDAAFPRSAAN